MKQSIILKTLKKTKKVKSKNETGKHIIITITNNITFYHYCYYCHCDKIKNELEK